MPKRGEREPPAPTPLDEVLSASCLQSSPWVLARIKALKLRGRLVRGWTPPQFTQRELRLQAR
jgi:hypothetical protein